MADRTDSTDRPFGPDAAEQPHIDLRTGARAERAPAASDTPPAPPAEQPDIAAGEVMHGDRHAAAVDPANHGQAHSADHAASTPSGSDRTGIETPTDGKSRKMLIGAVAAVIVILVLLILIPGEAEATSPLLTLWGA